MATTIRSTSLDFNAIKNNLKVYFQNQSEFADYNFEASGLSNLLDVLAYNTHINGLTANFALNEAFIGTAQLRSSVVSLAEGIGYIPYSRIPSSGIINLSLNLAGVAGRPASISIAAGKTFTASVDDITYTFQTRESISAEDNGSGLYTFVDGDDNQNIQIYEGTLNTKTFIADAPAQNAIYVIPEAALDTSTAVVRVYATPSSSAFATYTNLIDATTLSSTSTLYILKEAPNGYFELSFGDGSTFGSAPPAGSKIEIEYLVSAGPAANEATGFASGVDYSFGGTDYQFLVTSVSASAGGSFKESLESIRKNAPFQYAAQNRMVTAADYSTLILRNFGSYISDIKTWGGEENLQAKFGTVFCSIVFNADVDAATITSLKSQITDLANQLAILSFEIEFIDPVTTYIETETFFRFNPRLTTLSSSAARSAVNNAISNYFTTTVGDFDAAFRRSNLLTIVDETSPAILSSRMSVRMQQRITPTLGALNSITIRFPQPIASADDENYIITSSQFIFSGENCIIRNRLNSNVLEVFSNTSATVLVDNVGSYNADANTISISGFRPASIIGGVNYIKVKAVPANQSAIVPNREEILEFDAGESFARAVTTSATN